MVERLRSDGIEAEWRDDVDDILDGLRASLPSDSDTKATCHTVLLLSNGAFGGIYGKIRTTFH